MLLTIIGLALLFIILVNVVLFCLETEAVGIIISIIGILIFLSGGAGEAFRRRFLRRRSDTEGHRPHVAGAPLPDRSPHRRGL